eukprot:4160051-Prymnesium_polylepis.1
MAYFGRKVSRKAAIGVFLRLRQPSYNLSVTCCDVVRIVSSLRLALDLSSFGVHGERAPSTEACRSGVQVVRGSSTEAFRSIC